MTNKVRIMHACWFREAGADTVSEGVQVNPVPAQLTTTPHHVCSFLQGLLTTCCHSLGIQCWPPYSPYTSTLTTPTSPYTSILTTPTFP